MNKKENKIYQRNKRQEKLISSGKPLIQCLICKEWFRQVGSHIVQRHNMTAREYRKKYGFNIKKGQLPPDYKEKKAKQAIECQGYKNLIKGKKYWFKKNQKGIGTYKRSKETLENLKNTSGKKVKKRKKCLNCNKILKNRQRIYCKIECRQEHYKIKYNKHKTKLFTNN